MSKKFLLILILVLSLIIVPLFFLKKNNNGNIQSINQSKDLENLSIAQLIEKRNKCIDKNVEPLKKLNFSEQDLIDRKKEILNSEWGLVSFFNKNYSKLTEKEKLIKQIKLVEYINSKVEMIDPAGEYFNASNASYQIEEYLLKNEKIPDITSYENLKYLVNNLEDLSNFIDCNIKDVLENIDSLIQIHLSQEQKVNLSQELKKIYSDKNTSQEIKNNIKNLYSYTNN